MRAPRKPRGFFMKLVVDPMTNRPTFVVPLGRLPKGIRIYKAKKHHYLVCVCGESKRFTLFFAAKNKSAVQRGLARRAACISALAWAREHRCRRGRTAA